MKKEKKFLTIQLEATELGPAQERIIRYLNTMLLDVLTTNDEEEYFDAATETMRMCAALIKKANFTQICKHDISYGVQAVEYSLDVVAEEIEDTTTNFDN